MLHGRRTDRIASWCPIMSDSPAGILAEHHPTLQRKVLPWLLRVAEGPLAMCPAICCPSAIVMPSQLDHFLPPPGLKVAAL